jgi:hypothetical protein
MLSGKFAKNGLTSLKKFLIETLRIIYFIFFSGESIKLVTSLYPLVEAFTIWRKVFPGQDNFYIQILYILIQTPPLPPPSWVKLTQEAGSIVYSLYGSVLIFHNSSLNIGKIRAGPFLYNLLASLWVPSQGILRICKRIHEPTSTPPLPFRHENKENEKQKY